MALALGAVCLPLQAKERPWRKVVAANFTILTPGDDKLAIQWASDFSQFVAGLETFIQIDPKELPKLTIVLFARPRDLQPYRPLDANGKPEDVAGFFSRRESWAVAGLGGQSLAPETRRTVFHEGTHWYLSAAELPNPVWLDEGLAEVFSTFEIDGTSAEWGKPIRDHVLALAEMHLMPLERLLYLARSDLFGEGREGEERTSLAYAQSWLFVHYLMFGQRDVPKRALSEYARLLRLKNPDTAFQTAFGQSYAQIEAKLQDYLREGRYFVPRLPLAALPPLKAETASAWEVDQALGRLALVSGHYEEAKNRALALAGSDPTSPRGHELLGEVYEETGDSAGAVSAYQQAIARKSADYRPYYRVAFAKHQAAEAGDGSVRGLSDADARELADNYIRAVELNPRFEPAYESFAGIFPALDHPTERDERVLTQGHALFPKEGAIRIALAVMDYRAGRTESAQRALAEVIADPAPEAVRARRYARGQAQSWRQNEVIEQLNALADKSDFEHALPLIDANLNEAGGEAVFRMQLQHMRTQFAAARQLQAINAAVQDLRWHEARRLLEEFLASDAPPAMKSQARLLLARMDRRGLGNATAAPAP